MIKNCQQNITKKKSKICIVGLGYVGLPTAIYFAEQDFNIIGVDTNPEKVLKTNQGISTIGELNLENNLAQVVKNKKLSATDNLQKATQDSNIIILIVPTPITQSKDPDLSYIIEAGKEVVKGLNKGKLVILESTVYPGVTEEILQPILESTGLKAGVDFGLAYCPERYNPGDEKHTIQNVARLVGAITPEWAEITRQLYQTIIKEEVKVLKNIKTAEAAKVIENTQRDLNIALMNELAMIFERLDIDIMDVIEGAKTKWNFNIYYPGAGVGGHCLPVDPYYLVTKAKEVGYHSRVIAAGRTINDHMPTHVVNLTVNALNEHDKATKNSKIVILGLSYKENVGDPRESPSTIIIKKLIEKKANVEIIDPYIEESEYGTIKTDLYETLQDAHAIILVTAHDEFKNIDFKKAKQLMKLPIFIDGRRIYDPETIRELGFYYHGIGAIN